MARKRSPGGGRKPVLSKEGRRREQINFRADPKLLDRLRKEAKQNGQSLTAVIDARLRKSFEELSAAFGEGADRDFAVATVELAHIIRLRFGSWRENWKAFYLFRAAIPHLLDMMPPPGEAETPEKDNDLWAQAFALAVVANMQRAKSIGELEASPRGAKYRKMQAGLQPKDLLQSGGEERELSPDEIRANQAGIAATLLNMIPKENK